MTRRAEHAGPRGGEHVFEENRLWAGAIPFPAQASDCVRFFDSYGLLNQESTQPTGKQATTNL